jgi:hypothetical protein
MTFPDRLMLQQGRRGRRPASGRNLIGFLDAFKATLGAWYSPDDGPFGSPPAPIPRLTGEDQFA